MPPASSSFTPLNISNDVVPEWMGSFTLAAPPNTDLWRKPPSRDTSTAPILYTALRHPFVAAQVTVSADWELEWDQGGLVIFAGVPPGQAPRLASDVMPNLSNLTLEEEATPSTTTTSTSTTTSTTNPDTTTTTSTTTTTPPPPPPPPPSIGTPPTLSDTTQTHGQGLSEPQPRQRSPPPPYHAPEPGCKWVKVGLEFCNYACHATSVVANGDGADWSISALSPRQAARPDLRIKMERIGYALWVWYEDEVLGWKKLREVTWFFWGVDDKAVRVGVYASRPANFGMSMQDRSHGGAGLGLGLGLGGQNRGARNLCVDFEGLEIG